MTDSDESFHIEPEDARRFLKTWQVIAEAARPFAYGNQQELPERVEAHLGVEATGLESASVTLLDSEAVNHDLALEALDPAAELLGLNSDVGHMGRAVSMQALLSSQSYVPNEIVPVTWIEHSVGVDERRRCPVAAVALASFEGSPVAIGHWRHEQHGPPGTGGLRVEVLAADTQVAYRAMERLAELRAEHNVYRGQVLGFTFSEYGTFGLEFIGLPTVSRDQLILPDADLEAIERHAIDVSARADELMERGQHLKRGVLLYGPPGTGKTHTVTYLVGAMPGRTTIILQGPSAGAIGQAAAIARSFPPATIVIEDVDLIAFERSMGMGMGTPLLFQLLNEMDGFSDDSDLLFILTTNRAEVLEPALASRPGRIDQAVEIAKPDRAARVRLLRLYLGGAGNEVQDVDAAADRLAGVTASFVKELVRRASMNAIDAGTPIDDLILDETITELIERADPVVHRSLGLGEEQPSGPDGAPGIHFEF